MRYTRTVDAAGNWLVTIPANALSSLSDGAHTLTVNVVDAAGNTGTAELPFSAEFTAPQPPVDAEFLDGYINAADVAAGFTLSGTTGETGANQSVQVTMGGTVYSAITDANGNSSTISSSLVVDTTPPVLTVGTFAGDSHSQL